MVNIACSIILDLSIVIGSISPLIYGQYLEHIQPEEKIIYGGIFELDSPLSDEKGIRKDVIETLKEMKVPVVRWPGGCFADTYHWKNGIGDNRIGHQNQHWGGWEPNLFGTDEYLHLCNLLGAKTYICLNAGTGDSEEASEWVKYCKEKGVLGGLWGIGNELYGHWESGHCSAEEYSEKVLEFGQKVRSIDQNAKLVAVGAPNMKWNKTVLERCTSLLDYISIHMYAHSFLGTEWDYFNVVGAPVRFEEALKEVISLLRQYDPQQRIKIAVDEWNVRHMYGKYLDRKDPRNLQDALFTAGVLNTFQRLCNDVALANYVFMVNGHAPILVREDIVLKSPLYYIFYAYQHFSYDKVVKIYVENCPIYRSVVKDIGGWGGDKEIDIPLIDVSATTNLKDKASISIINRAKETVRIDLKFLGSIGLIKKIRLWTLSGDSPLLTNTWNQPERIILNVIELQEIKNILLKPYSVNFLMIDLY